MGELNLGDLEDFNESSLQLFDEETGVQGNKEKEGEVKPGSTDTNNDDKKNTDGDDTSKEDQESVADQDKDKNQVQAGETSKDGDGSDSSSPKLNETEQLYSNLAAEFKAKGVLPELDITKIKSLEDIEEAIKKQVESGLTDRQKYLEEAQKSGASVTDVSEKMNTIEKLKEVSPEYIQDETNGDFRSTAITQDFMQKGYTEERAREMAQRSVDNGTDIEDAQFALKALIEAEETSLQGLMTDAKGKEDKSLSDIKSYIATTPEVVPGVTLTDSQKDELYSQITSDLGNKENAFMQAQKADPVGSRIKLEALFYLTKGLTDFNVFGNKQESKISTDLENLIRGAKFTSEGSVETNTEDSQSNFKLSDLKDFEIE
ncbi:hypothetical protein [Clostridium sp.]|jgi:hypothetical protein|uniref:hypothetical protein n=1 Tax=Clostridium sp. TaxID=1506 RepID=UPI003EEC0502